jgi:hypothetical protein
MSEKTAAAFGIFPDRMGIETVVSSLKREGFSNSDISVLFRESRGTWGQTRPMSSVAAAAARATSLSVGSCYGALRWLVGLSPVTIPGKGIFVAVGPVRAALESNTSNGTHGPLAGSLIGMGVPEYHAKRYESWLENRWFLLSVQFTDAQRMIKLKRILAATLAEDILFTHDPNSCFLNPETGETVVAGSGIYQSRIVK